MSMHLLIADAPFTEWHAPAGPERALRPLTTGGARRWTETQKTRPQIGGSGGPFAFNSPVHPSADPWRVPMPVTWLYFLPRGQTPATRNWERQALLVAGLGDPAGARTGRRAGP